MTMAEYFSLTRMSESQSLPSREDAILMISPTSSCPHTANVHTFDPRRSSRHYRSFMFDRRGSFLSTASLALTGVVPRTSKSSSPDDRQFPDIRQPRTFWRKCRQSAQYLYEKSRLKYFLPLMILVGYSFLGGAVIYWIEAPIERWQMEGKQKFLDEQKTVLTKTLWQVRENRSERRQALMTLRESVFWYTVTTLYMGGNFTRIPPHTSDVTSKVKILRTYTEQMSERCWEIRLEISNLSDARRKIEEALKLFESYTGITTEVKPIWTFSNALFLAVTIYTTIGYGSIAPHTVSGRVATIIFAIIGIPIYVIIIHKLGRVFLKLLHKFWKFVLRLTLYCTCASGLGRLRKQSLAGQDSIYNIPVSLAVGVTFAWMLTCAGICCLFFETSWDYFTSFYFFFISLTTIGLGDVTPTHPEYMFTMFGLIIVGLSLVSMCINVVQLKLELLFEEMMLALMEEYQKSGQIVDGEMVSEADLHRGLGFSQLFRLWKKKHAALKSSVISTTSAVPVAAGGLLLPLMAKKRSAAVLRRLQRRSRERTTGTQTDAWTKSVDYRYFPWCEREQATQTDWTIPIESVSPSLVTCSGSISSFPLNRASQDDEEQFHSDISVYNDVGCPHKRSLQHLHYLEQLAGVDESKRPWSSLDSPAHTVLAGKTPLPISPLCKADKHTSTPAVSQLDNPWRTRLRRTGILDAVETMPKGILRRPPYDHTVQMPGRLSPHYTSYYYRTSPIAFAEHPQLDHCRYWLAEFQPEAPPGGGVPAMYIRRQANDPACDEFKSLIREIGCRLDECRHIVKQQQEPRRGSVAKQSK